MRMFSPDARAAARALRPDADTVDVVVARAAWSVIAEPGDGAAGALIREVGAVEALLCALDRRSPEEASRRVRTATDLVGVDKARARWLPRADPRAVVQALESARHVKARLLLPGDAEWPASLDDLDVHAPVALWVRGRPALLAARRRVAIVGARASTPYGEHLAAELAGDLAQTGAVIVSGGAYGIDGAAHRAALRVDGPTVALLAGGVDRAYPAGHQRLLTEIAARGAVVSEVPCGAAPTKWRFLARNRLIAALGDATVVVEAGWRSGSLNTAGHAASLGRPLGAVPGPVTSAASAGCHRLLREYDARCVTTTQEVRELWGEAPVPGPAVDAPDPDRTRLLDALSSRSALPVQELARRSGLDEARIAALLGILDLEGAVRRTDGGWRRAAR
ncbi:DNA-processing protein DprA [uncultured Microbacterium sp.]|uniref:DNA-processing protein DprA n=1 Tax=uncultured Microbacterium sp. TaxID=191216 RepID=UPI0028DC4CA3|nr:DNA-processing protein DprA [uncultured Microbacterium sp.]